MHNNLPFTYKSTTKTQFLKYRVVRGSIFITLYFTSSLLQELEIFMSSEIGLKG